MLPEWDAFSNVGNWRCKNWWGPGSPFGEDAFEQSWAGKVLWLNPPFDFLDRVLAKLVKDGAHGILVLPEWPRRKYFQTAMNLCLDQIHFPKGFKFFERPGWMARGLQWPVRVVLIVDTTLSVSVADFAFTEKLFRSLSIFLTT